MYIAFLSKEPPKITQYILFVFLVETFVTQFVKSRLTSHHLNVISGASKFNINLTWPYHYQGYLHRMYFTLYCMVLSRQQ